MKLTYDKKTKALKLERTINFEDEVWPIVENIKYTVREWLAANEVKDHLAEVKRFLAWDPEEDGAPSVDEFMASLKDACAEDLDALATDQEFLDKAVLDAVCKWFDIGFTCEEIFY